MKKNYCACGCGGLTKIYRGVPNKYINGHSGSKAAKISNKKRSGNHSRLQKNRQKYIDEYGYPICKICGTKVGFHKNRSKPRILCDKHVGSSEFISDLWNNNPKYKAAMDRVMSSDNYKRTMVESTKQLWEDESFREKVLLNSPSPDEISHKMRSLWDSDEYRNKMMNILNSKEYRKKISDAMIEYFKDSNNRDKVATRSKKLWQDDNFRNKMASIFNDREFLLKMSENSKSLWEDAEYRNKTVDAIRNSVNRISKSVKEAWQKGRCKYLESYNNEEVKKRRLDNLRLNNSRNEYRAKMSESIRNKWQDQDYYNKMIEARKLMPKVSSIQNLLYSMLDDLGIRYYREYNDKSDDPQCVVGPYSFDCVIPRNNKPDLLIECQGDYWHSTDKSIRNDNAKSSYISNNFPGQYELKYLWEHEFQCKDRIFETLKYWLGISELEIIDFEFSDVKIKKCEATDYKELLSKYHYLPNAGRGGISYGAYLNNRLAAVCVFSPLPRQNISVEGYKIQEVRELSRLCIHPKYQKKNFASWFVSRCIKMLPNRYRCIISYCDTTFNHDGAVYKALNFKQDKTVKPDYWYVSEDGWVMHKKTLYNHAKKMSMKEREFANLNGYTKVYGREKLRFVLEVRDDS